VPEGADPRAFGSVGLPYDRVLGILRDEFPGCATTVACLRWYVVKAREGALAGAGGVRFPRRRPRVRPASK
jgi:hypothetical protein